VQLFVSQELPILIEKGYVTEFRNITENCNVLNGSAGSGTFVPFSFSKRRGERNFEPTRPFGHGISNFNEKDFENQLKLQKKTNFKQIFCYALKYKGVLLTGDAKVLLSLPSAQRRHAMEGLASLSKYTGCYDNWKNIREKYQLRWTNSEQENLKYFTNYMVGKGNFDEMVKWLRNAMTKLPKDAANVLVFNTLTGLRPTEAVLSLQLIKIEREKCNN